MALPLFDKPQFGLRPYQLEAHKAIRAAFLRGIHAMIVCLPTGMGKTILMTLFARVGCRVLFIAPQTELIKQWTSAIRKHRGIAAEIEQAEMIADLDGGLQFVATNQSLLSKLSDGRKRYEKFIFDKDDYRHIPLVVVDECDTHFSVPIREMLQDFIDHGSTVVGVTATPYRTRKKDSLFGFYEECVYSMELREAFSQGWLVQPVIWSHEVTSINLDQKRLKSKWAEDFDPILLEQELLREAPLHEMCALIAKVHDPEKHHTMVSFPGKKVSMQACDMLRERHGINAVQVYGVQHPDEKAEALEKFKSGEATVICNVRVLGRGVDIPKINQVVNCAISCSKSKTIQQMGRATRTVDDCISGIDTPEERLAAIKASAKPTWEYHDLTATTKFHSLVTAVDLLIRDKSLAEAIKEKQADDEPMTLDELDAEEQAERNRLKELERLEREAEAERKRKLVLGCTFDSQTVELWDERTATSPKQRTWRFLFGQYKGRPLRDPIVELSYLEWYLTKQTRPMWIAAVSAEIERRRNKRSA